MNGRANVGSPEPTVVPQPDGFNQTFFRTIQFFHFSLISSQNSAEKYDSYYMHLEFEFVYSLLKP